MRILPLAFLAASAALGCTIDPPPMLDARPMPFIDGGFACLYLEAEACVGNAHHYCAPDGEFLQELVDDCGARGEVCVEGRWCITCRPGSRRCNESTPQMCNDEGTAWIDEPACEIARGEACVEGACVNLCEQALIDRSYEGCEFYAADLDNASLGAGRDASAQQYAIVVSNPGTIATEVVIERDEGTFGGADVVTELESVIIAPGDLEVFRLPRREVDGSSGFNICGADNECSTPDRCLCSGGTPPGPGARDCRCRNRAGAGGMNDGTHSALTARGYRIRSVLPVIAYQFNPLDNVGVFSNDASLLLPTSALGDRYTVVAWPQTIADSDIPQEDFDSRRDDEDLRSFLTVVGTTAGTRVTVNLGGAVREVHGITASAPVLSPGDVVEVDLGPFDVLNLETHGFNGDFTGTVVTANNPVAIFAGSEASDAPRFDDLANRRCCADHLEEQLFPDDVLGGEFYIGRTPSRSPALNRAFLTPDSVGAFTESEWVRVVAVDPGLTVIETTLPPPLDSIELGERESIVLEADQNFRILSQGGRLAVLQVLASQEAVGIPNDYPGGDPAIIAVPPVGQWRQEYVFLTPDLYAFDFLTIVARSSTAIEFDGEALDPINCSVTAADGIPRMPGDPPPEFVVYGCQISFPDVLGPPPVRVEDGTQDDGYHTLVANAPISIIVSGWDSFVSYAYAGGLNLDPVN